MSTISDLDHPRWCNPTLCKRDEYGDPVHRSSEIVVDVEEYRWVFDAHQYHELKHGDEGIGLVWVDVRQIPINYNEPDGNFDLVRDEIPQIVNALMSLYCSTGVTQ